MEEKLKELRERLSVLPAGEIENPSDFIFLLSECWGEFSGSNETKMTSEKISRAEELTWEPPDLCFKIERHGRTVNGSGRADLYCWAVNVETRVARCGKSGHRQLCPMDKRVDVRPLAAEIATLILDGKQDPRLKWYPDGKVQVLIGDVVSGNNKQTIDGRRKRFRREMNEHLLPAGWQTVRANVYRKIGESKSEDPAPKG